MDRTIYGHDHGWIQRLSEALANNPDEVLSLVTPEKLLDLLNVVVAARDVAYWSHTLDQNSGDVKRMLLRLRVLEQD